MRLDAPLYFFNANVARAQIRDLLGARRPAPHGLLIDLAATADLDVTTTDMLFELAGDLEAQSIELLLAQVKGSVRDRLRRTGLMTRIGEDRLYLSIGSAVTDFQRRWPPDAVAMADRAASRGTTTGRTAERRTHRRSPPRPMRPDTITLRAVLAGAYAAAHGTTDPRRAALGASPVGVTAGSVSQ